MKMNYFLTKIYQINLLITNEPNKLDLQRQNKNRLIFTKIYPLNLLIANEAQTTIKVGIIISPRET